jgi:hypothetical protein
MLPVLFVIALLTACDPTLDLKTSNGGETDKNALEGYDPTDQNSSATPPELQTDDAIPKPEEEKGSADASDEGEKEEAYDEAEQPEAEDLSKPEEEDCDEDAGTEGDEKEDVEKEEFEGPCECEEKEKGDEEEKENDAEEEFDDGDEEKENDAEKDFDDSDEEKENDAEKNFDDGDKECTCKTEDGGDKPDDDKLGSDDAWDTCAEATADCEDTEAECLQLFSSCLQEANEDTTCLDEAVSCLQAGDEEEGCFESIDLCLESAAATQAKTEEESDQPEEYFDDGDDSQPVDVFAIGDSMLEWNEWEQASIPEVAGQLSGMTVKNAAISGAQFLPEDGIPSQYIPGNYKAVLIAGGANDLNDGCVCGGCLSKVDAIIDAAALSGKMVNLVNNVTSNGAQVILIGYYQALPGSEFEGCEQERIALNSRYASLAVNRPNVTYIDPTSVMTPTSTPGFYDEDKIHPSASGSAAIGKLVGQVLLSD